RRTDARKISLASSLPFLRWLERDQPTLHVVTKAGRNQAPGRQGPTRAPSSIPVGMQSVRSPYDLKNAAYLWRKLLQSGVRAYPAPGLESADAPQVQRGGAGRFGRDELPAERYRFGAAAGPDVLNGFGMRRHRSVFGV